MPRNTPRPRKAGTRRVVADLGPAPGGRKAPTREALRRVRAQTKGDKPPRFPGRTGGR